jgi:hypothetical protein
MPGTDPREVARIVLGELPDLPYLPELPARGGGADIIGRSAGVLPDLYVDLQPSGWRFVPRPGLDTRRAVDLLARDLDAFQEAALELAPARVKVQLAGPWTLAAGIELHRGDRALADRGAVRDIAESLAEAAPAHVDDLRRRLPGTEVVLQLDEPSLPAVLLGHVPTASGYDVIAAVEEQVAMSAIRQVVDAVDGPVGVHCCAADPPVTALRGTGVAFLSLDLALLERTRGTAYDDVLGDCVEGGVILLAGSDDPAATVRGLWSRLSLPVETMATSVVVTPTCGLADRDPEDARAVLTSVREAGQRLYEKPEGP